MIPTIQQITPLPAAKTNDKTFYINYNTNRIEGYIDGLEAVEQSIISMLSTERYAYLIHTWQYGAVMEKYIGTPYDYIIADVGREITETLLTDNRILRVHSFTFDKNQDEIYITFVADTIFGSTKIETNQPI